MKPKAKSEHFKCLEEVITLAEAARLYYVSAAALSYAIDRNLIAAKRCGRTVLISVASLNDYFDKKLSNIPF